MLLRCRAHWLTLKADIVPLPIARLGLIQDVLFQLCEHVRARASVWLHRIWPRAVLLLVLLSFYSRGRDGQAQCSRLSGYVHIKPCISTPPSHSCKLKNALCLIRKLENTQIKGRKTKTTQWASIIHKCKNNMYNKSLKLSIINAPNQHTLHLNLTLKNELKTHDKRNWCNKLGIKISVSPKSD